MEMNGIVLSPDPRLRQECAVIEEITPEIEQIVERMKVDMFENGGCGLAAPQIGELIQLAIVDTEYSCADDYEPEIEQIVERMKVDMFENGGCGLAAPQIGELIQLAIVDTEYSCADDYDPFVLINPVIVEQSDTMAPFDEGCLSIPGINCRIMRPDHVVVEAYNLEGDLMRYEASHDLFCVCLQHEIDHLRPYALRGLARPVLRLPPARDRPSPWQDDVRAPASPRSHEGHARVPGGARARRQARGDQLGSLISSRTRYPF